MNEITNEELASYKKWSLKEKINFIREYLGDREFSVTLKHNSVEWVGVDHPAAGNVRIKFLQEMGELGFDKKIISYFNLMTDLPDQSSTATQREKKIRENAHYYDNDREALFKQDEDNIAERISRKNMKFDDNIENDFTKNLKERHNSKELKKELERENSTTMNDMSLDDQDLNRSITDENVIEEKVYNSSEVESTNNFEQKVETQDSSNEYNQNSINNY